MYPSDKRNYKAAETMMTFNDVAICHPDKFDGDDAHIVCIVIQHPAVAYNAFSGSDSISYTSANSSLVSSLYNPECTYDVDVDRTLKVLMAAMGAKVDKLVYSASSSVYGNIQAERMREDMAPQPNTPYAVSKLLGEYYCKVFNDVYGLRTTSLRYFNVFGPRQDLTSAYASVIPKFIRQVKAGKKITIEGDGEQSRDFVYVMDVVQANLLASINDRSDGEVINIARGEKNSINEISEKILKYYNINNSNFVEYKEARQADIRHSLADISKANSIMKYHPNYGVINGIEIMCARGGI